MLLKEQNVEKKRRYVFEGLARKAGFSPQNQPLELPIDGMILITDSVEIADKHQEYSDDRQKSSDETKTVTESWDTITSHGITIECNDCGR